MVGQSLAELLLAVDHVGELGRLLAVLAGRGGGGLGRRELLGLTSRTAGAGPRYPRPIAALELALRFGLVKSATNSIRLTELGAQFLRRPSARLIDLSAFQGRLLLGLILDDGEMREKIRQALTYFEQGDKRALQTRAGVVIPEALRPTLRLLQQLGAVQYAAPWFILAQEFELLLVEGPESGPGLSEEALWLRLEAQRERAQAIEKLVLKEEQRRLTEAGRVDLAEVVFRISEVNVGAGYDIASFELDGSRRFIEVKSSAGRLVRFEWSVNERRQAQALRTSYWIYFVPTAHALPEGFCPVVMIRDPMEFIRRGIFTEVPSRFEVSETAGTPIDTKITFSLARRVVNFWFMDGTDL